MRRDADGVQIADAEAASPPAIDGGGGRDGNHQAEQQRGRVTVTRGLQTEFQEGGSVGFREMQVGGSWRFLGNVRALSFHRKDFKKFVIKADHKGIYSTNIYIFTNILLSLWIYCCLT